MHEQPIAGEFRIKQYDGHGELLKARAGQSVEAIIAEQPADYRVSIEEACRRAQHGSGSWQEIILGPPELAGAVDRLKIQAVL